MGREAAFTPRNQHPDKDEAIASGARCSAKDGTKYIQRTEQEDLTVRMQSCITSCLLFEKGYIMLICLIIDYNRFATVKGESREREGNQG